MPAAVKFKLRDDHLRRWLAGDVSARALGRELRVSDTAVRAHLKTPAVAKRITSLQSAPESAHEKPAQTRPAKGKGYPVSAVSPVAEGLSGTFGHTVTSGPGLSFSVQGAGKGLGRVGFSRSRAVALEERPTITVSDGTRAYHLDAADEETIEHYRDKGWRIHAG